MSPSDTEVLLLQEQSALTNGYPVLRSKDRGGTWEAITLPPAPGMSPEEVSSADFPRLTVFRNGHLLAFTPAGTVLLSPGADQWCRVAGTPFGDGTPSSRWLQATGNRLWWVDDEGAVHSVEQERVRCR